MRKTKQYRDARFPAHVLRRLIDEVAKPEFGGVIVSDWGIDKGVTRWEYDSSGDFFEGYNANPDSASFAGNNFHLMDGQRTIATISFTYNNNHGHISTKLLFSTTLPNGKEIIDQIFAILDGEYQKYIVPPLAMEEEVPTVFIGHGGSRQWRDLKDHLIDKHGFRVEAYETGARAGHTIRDILDDMLKKSSFALLVLTAEDEMSNGDMRARQNVIHETGLFQGRLGFNKAIVLLEEGAEEFSNIFGIQQIRYGKGNIREAFGDVLATLRREFPR